MASETAIANEALNFLGASRIDTLDAAVPNSQAMAKVIVSARETTLQAYDWPFARGRALLETTTAVPGFDEDYQYAFQKPVDCLQVRACIDPTSEASVEYIEVEALILSNEESLYLRYTKRVTATGLFPALFCTAMAYQMAIRGCYSVTKSAKLLPELRAGYSYALSEAQRVDAVHQSRKRKTRKSPWTLARTR